MSELVEVGAMWTKVSAAGNEYFSLNIGGHWCKAFRNTKKQPGSKQPDFRIMCDDEEFVTLYGKPEYTPKAAPPESVPVQSATDAMDSVPF